MGLWDRRSRFGHYDAASTNFTFSADPVHYFSRMYLGNFKKEFHYNEEREYLINNTKYFIMRNLT